jgi:hypothetical protein
MYLLPRSLHSNEVIFRVAISSRHVFQCENEIFCNSVLYCKISIIWCFVYGTVRESDRVRGRIWIENVGCIVLNNAGIFNHRISICVNCSSWRKWNLRVLEDVTTFNFIFCTCLISLLSTNEEYESEQVTEFESRQGQLKIPGT